MHAGACSFVGWYFEEAVDEEGNKSGKGGEATSSGSSSSVYRTGTS